MDCVFCKIVEGEIPSYTIFEDDLVKAFLDIHPDTNGHILIIPKRHYVDIMDLNSVSGNHIFEIAKKLKTKLEDKLHIDGLTLVQNNGDAQEVKHFHLHLKPYYNTPQELLPVEEVYQLLR